MKFLLPLILFTNLVANDSGFIYGKIVLKDGNQYQGPIRWGEKYGQEYFWLDTFDASKTENHFEKYIDQSDLQKIEKRNFFSFLRRSFSDDKLSTHQFVVHFGDIKQIQSRGRHYVDVVLKNNETYEVSGSDVGETLYIIDETDNEQIKIKWKKVDYVEFMETPKSLKRSFGDALYGILETENGTYKGLIQWDYEESLLNEELNGDEDDLFFREISSIHKEGRNGVSIVLKNGRKRYLSGTNDVDRDNRGIVLKNMELGKIEVYWDEFVSLEIGEKGVYSGPAYSEFQPAKALEGSIQLNSGETIAGRFAFDLDETYSVEMIDGKLDDMNFSIPIRNIKEISPKGRYSAIITLQNDIRFSLYDQTDVSKKNSGILIWAENKTPSYYSWNEIKTIQFK